MQLMIDLNVETPAALRLAAAFLVDNATLREAAEQGAPLTAPSAPAGNHTPYVPPVPQAPHEAAAPSNVVPFPPPVPPAPPAAMAPASASNVAPGAATAPPTGAPTAGQSSAGAAERQYDTAGMPWDSRIHQKAKGIKKDGSWKLIKGIDENIVKTVVQELNTLGLIRTAGSTAPSAPPAPPAPEQTFGAPPEPTFGRSPLPVGAVAPVPLPGGVPVPPAPPGVPGVPASPNVGAGNVPVPPMPAAGGVPLDPFRSLVAKITAARTGGRITPEQVTQLVQQAGAPSLQMLNSMQSLIPTVDSLIDAHLAST